MFLTACVIGVCVGLGSYTFDYDVLGFLSNDTKTCANFHIMNDKYDCKAFTLANFHEPIMINDANSWILQGNCVRCHQEIDHSREPQLLARDLAATPGGR